MPDDEIVENEIENPIEKHIASSANSVTKDLAREVGSDGRWHDGVDSVDGACEQCVKNVGFHEFGAKIEKMSHVWNF